MDLARLLNVLFTFGSFVVVLGIIIFFHESGHFFTAKLMRMKVFIFSFGFGRRLFGFKWGDTDCRVSLVPLGGYVKLEGEPDDYLSERTEAAVLNDGEIVNVESPDYFTNRPRWQRFVVYLAGPFMNGVLTVGVFSVLFMIGWQVDASLYDRPVVGVVEPASPAEAAGLLPGDELLSIDGRTVETWEQAQTTIMLRPDTTLAVHVRRGREEKELTVHSKSTARDKIGEIGVWPLVRVGELIPGLPAEGSGLKSNDGLLRVDDKPVHDFNDVLTIVTGSEGRSLSFTVERGGSVMQIPITPAKTPEGYRVGMWPKRVMRRFGPAGAVAEAFRFTWVQTKLTFETVGRLLTAKISPKTMMGPLGIAKASGDAARGGVGALFFLVAIISLQVGILNLFPLAPLDGGHMAILVSEGALRRDFSLTVKAWILNAGAMVLFLLIGLVLYSDLSKTSWLSKYLP